MHHTARTAFQFAALMSALMALTPMASAQQWKWRDANGQIQYSDRPPPASVAEKDVLVRPRTNIPSPKPLIPQDPASAASATLPATPVVDKRLEAERKKAEEAEKERQKADKTRKDAQRAEECARAKAYQKDLNDGVRISRTNAKGEREILDDKGRDAEKARVREAMSSLCK
jgi:hypothetical protein